MEQKKAEKREHLSEPDGFNSSPLTHMRASIFSKILLLKLLALIEITEQVGGSLLNATRANGLVATSKVKIDEFILPIFCIGSAGLSRVQIKSVL